MKPIKADESILVIINCTLQLLFVQNNLIPNLLFKGTNVLLPTVRRCSFTVVCKALPVLIFASGALLHLVKEFYP